MIDNKFIAEKIKNARELLGLTQEELGKLIGISKQSISSWEKGRNLPDILNIDKIANLSGIKHFRCFKIKSLVPAKSFLCATEVFIILFLYFQCTAAVYASGLKIRLMPFFNLHFFKLLPSALLILLFSTKRRQALCGKCSFSFITAITFTANGYFTQASFGLFHLYFNVKKTAEIP